MPKEPITTLDITADNCPMTFVKTKLMLEELEEGQVLEVFLNSGEPIENVPRSVENEGHKILAIEPLDNGNKFRLLIQKGAD